jgi:hypothetical protein
MNDDDHHILLFENNIPGASATKAVALKCLVPVKWRPSELEYSCLIRTMCTHGDFSCFCNNSVVMLTSVEYDGYSSDDGDSSLRTHDPTLVHKAGEYFYAMKTGVATDGMTYHLAISEFGKKGCEWLLLFQRVSRLRNSIHLLFFKGYVKVLVLSHEHRGLIHQLFLHTDHIIWE